MWTWKHVNSEWGFELLFEIAMYTVLCRFINYLHMGAHWHIHFNHWSIAILKLIALHGQRAHTHTHTHTHTHRTLHCNPPPPPPRLSHTHTHTHTHVGFYGLRGLSIGVMVFILYKLYVLLPYTYPTPKLSPHRRRCISTLPPKNAHCMIYKRFKLWGHWKCPHKSNSPCNTSHTHVIIQICVLINHINMHTHTHTHTHTWRIKLHICTVSSKYLNY